MTYHILRVRAQTEAAVKERLEQRNVEAVVPVETTVAIRRGRKISFERALLTRYVFASGDLERAQATSGVHGVVRYQASKEPATVSAEAVAALTAPVKPQHEHGLRMGDSATIMEGAPLAGFSGKVVALRKGRATVLVNVFGRPTPVEVQTKFLAKAAQ